MVTLNIKLLYTLTNQVSKQSHRLYIMFMIAGISFIVFAIISIFLNIYNYTLITGTINGPKIPYLIFFGVLFIGVSQIFYNVPRRLDIIATLTAISILIWIIYISIFFFVRINVLSSVKPSPFYTPIFNYLKNPLILQSLHILIISLLVTYVVVFAFLFSINKSFKKFSPMTLGMGLIFILILAGDAISGTINNEFSQNLLSVSGSNVMENFVTFSIILISLGLAIAFISYLFPKISYFKLFFTLLTIALLFQLALFYETSLAYFAGSLFLYMHGRYFIDPILEGLIEILIFAVVCYIALEFSASIKNKRSIIELLSILIPVSGTAFILLIVLKLIGNSFFIGGISINVGLALVLYFSLILTATITIFLSRLKNNKHGNFLPVVFPILILAIPMFGLFSISNTMNFQILFIYTIIIITSAIFIADTISILLSNIDLPVIGKLSISYIVNEENFSEPKQEEKPSQQIIIDDTVKKPIPKYWIGKSIWGYTITEIDDSFDPSFFHLFSTNHLGTFRRLSIMVLKQYSSHGVKLALDNNIIELMNRRYSGLIKLKDINNIQQVLETRSNSAESYIENQDNYKNSPPVVIMEDVQRRELTSLDWSLGSLKSKQVFHKVVSEILSSLEKAHSLGIIHGNICMSSVFIESNARLSEFTNVISSDQNLDNLILSENIRVKTGGFGGEVFEPYQYKETFGFIPYYHPPEYVVMNQLATVSWDIYEISCLLYELLSGSAAQNIGNRNIWARINFIRTKIGNNSFYDTMEQMIGDIERFPIEPLYSINKNVSIDLWNIIKKGLNPDPKLRFSSIAEMKESINNVLRENYGVGKEQDIN